MPSALQGDRAHYHEREHVIRVLRLPVNYPLYDPYSCSHTSSSSHEGTHLTSTVPFPDSVSQRCPFEKAASARRILVTEDAR